MALGALGVFYGSITEFRIYSQALDSTALTAIARLGPDQLEAIRTLAHFAEPSASVRHRDLACDLIYY